MKCPYCLESFHDQATTNDLGEDKFSEFTAVTRVCPACGRMIVHMHERFEKDRGGNYLAQRAFALHPRSMARESLHPSVGDEFAQDYREACNTLADSPKASAALSRRCLQHILREKAGVKKQDLAREIQEVIDSGKLPSYISESLDAIRNTGNFAAHPMKSTNSGEILEVEPGEAEWNLDVLESLFDFYFVQPDILAKKQAALNAKLASAGKPPMKK